MHTQQEEDNPRCAETARVSATVPAVGRRTDERGDELIDIGGVTVYLDGLAHAIVDALDDEFA